MRIALKVGDEILKKALEIFLSEYLCDENSATFVVSDGKCEVKKPIFYIADNGNISVPFSKDELIGALEKFYQKLGANSYEHRIDALVEEFKNNLKIIIKDEYER